MAATQKTLFILAYAILEWTLILMLLLNSLFSFLIRKFATYYALKPPCFWCSTIDHLLEPNDDINPFHNLICEAHATEFMNVCRNGKCSYTSMNFKVDSVDKSSHSASKIQSSHEENEMVQVMDLCILNTSRHIQVFDQIIPIEWTDSSTSCSRGSSLNGDENMVINDEDQVKKEGEFLQSSGYENEEDEENKVATIDGLMAELKSERLVVCGLYIELDEERNASAIAANQAMAMITRLQEDKVSLQIESMQNQRMMDEQAEYDKEVLQLLNELVMKLEKDKFELENELEMYKERFLNYDGKKKAKVKRRSITKKCLDDTNVVDLKNSKTLEESVVEFDVERLWILDKLGELDETLMMLTDDRDEGLHGKASFERERLSYKGNLFLGVFDIESIDEGDEASHSVWPIQENIKKKGDTKEVEV
ncbi:unnamed protein product [Lactuca virosa]|uniref:GTD-binding domain-containing protein n=1 Tax=Lactuca virosa TaxID=75947 RepID=A0AAU9NGF5_9ASTR|nr:unnamed protein product [Lactuca virosa]